MKGLEHLAELMADVMTRGLRRVDGEIAVNNTTYLVSVFRGQPGVFGASLREVKPRPAEVAQPADQVRTTAAPPAKPKARTARSKA